VGDDLFKKLSRLTINAAKACELAKANDLNQVNVDTTVQKQAITLPTDARLHHKDRRTLVLRRSGETVTGCLRCCRFAVLKNALKGSFANNTASIRFSVILRIKSGHFAAGDFPESFNSR